MSHINEKLGLKSAGARHRLNALSGVQCPSCRGAHVMSNLISGRLLWMCGFCSESWEPTLVEIQKYNGRVRDRDRIVLKGAQS